jgi:hypothetical protein
MLRRGAQLLVLEQLGCWAVHGRECRRTCFAWSSLGYLWHADDDLMLRWGW